MSLTRSGALFAGALCAGMLFGPQVQEATGVLTGAGAHLSGNAHRTRWHDVVGVLTGPNAIIVGAANRATVRYSSGILAGAGAAIVGDAARLVQHGATGVLSNPGASLSGVAVYNALHGATGDLYGLGGALAGLSIIHERPAPCLIAVYLLDEPVVTHVFWRAYPLYLHEVQAAAYAVEQVTGTGVFGNENIGIVLEMQDTARVRTVTSPTNVSCM